MNGNVSSGKACVAHKTTTYKNKVRVCLSKQVLKHCMHFSVMSFKWSINRAPNVIFWTGIIVKLTLLKKKNYTGKESVE